MRIGIDARFYGTIGKGLGRYAKELIAQLETIDRDNDYVVFLRRANFDEYVPKNPRFTKALAEFPWYGWREQLLYPFWLAKYRLDLMHFTHFNVPLLYRKPFVVTIHDLILLRHPTTRATTLGPLLFGIKFLAYRAVIARALYDAREILAVSKCTADDIRERFPFTRGKKITVTPLACSPSLAAARGDASRALAIATPFLLYVGNAYPHKNLETLLAAFVEFRRRGFPDHRLVLVGAPDYFYERLRREAATKRMDDHVLFFGQASETELATLYGRAQFYVFPSLHEGFGLPPLEAMCKGLPVASSDASCLPETLGDAASFFDAKNSGAIANALIHLAGDESLRAELTAKGKAWSARFDWRACATLTKEAYLHA